MIAEMGTIRPREATEVATSTTRPASVAYATEESGSEAKIGSAIQRGSSSSSRLPIGMRRPTIVRLTPRPETLTARCSQPVGSATTCTSMPAVPRSTASTSEPPKRVRSGERRLLPITICVMCCALASRMISLAGLSARRRRKTPPSERVSASASVSTRAVSPWSRPSCGSTQST